MKLICQPKSAGCLLTGLDFALLVFMDIYWLGNYIGQLSNNSLLSRYCISVIQSSAQFNKILERPISRQTVFFLELNMLTEKKFVEIENWVKVSGDKLKIIVFYQQVEKSPLINKMHGKNILLISPSDRQYYETLTNRFLKLDKPHFRRWERVRLNLKADIRLLGDEKSNFKSTYMLNFSSFGALLSLSESLFNVKDFVTLIYYSHDHRKVAMQSRVAWVENTSGGYLIGVQFISLGMSA